MSLEFASPFPATVYRNTVLGGPLQVGFRLTGVNLVRCAANEAPVGSVNVDDAHAWITLTEGTLPTMYVDTERRRLQLAPPRLHLDYCMVGGVVYYGLERKNLPTSVSQGGSPFTFHFRIGPFVQVVHGVQVKNKCVINADRLPPQRKRSAVLLPVVVSHVMKRPKVEEPEIPNDDGLDAALFAADKVTE